jgi:hypothetical protein
MPDLKTVRADFNFNDNFDDGVADGWTQWSGSWSVTEGQYFVSVGIVEYGITTVNGLDITNCIIETKLRYTDSVGFRAGIVFRFIDSTHYYLVQISNEYDTLSIVKYSPEYPSYGEVIAQLKDNIVQRDIDYQLKVIVSGSVFRCFINGEERLNGTDRSYTHGGVGLRAKRADVYFDNFRVENAAIHDDIISDNNTTDAINSELLAWWKLNEGDGTVVSDSSGNNYKGTINGAKWVNYKGTSSLNFNGVSDYVSLPSMDFTNLDSLTVVAWINSDLTKLGLIIYHGDVGEFHMGNGALEQDANWLNTNPTYANFGVKLSNFNWYGVSSSAPMQPNIWHQIAGVWSKGAFLKIYVDGVLAGENNFIPSLDLNNPGSSFPSSLGVVSQDRWNVPDFFKGQISNVMIFNKALTTQEMNALYDDVPIPTVARPILNLTCKSSTSYSGFNVEIKGNLSVNGTAIPDAPIVLSYSVNGGKSREDLTLVYTDSDGRYSAQWLPSVTGNYLVKATYEGDEGILAASSEIVNFAVTQFAEKNVLFSVSSNSKVTSLAFNSTTLELSFTVSGASGTTGYAEVTLAKSLVSNPENIKVYLDGNHLSYEVTSNEDSWLLTFTYTHSTHNVIVSLATSENRTASLGNELLIIGAAIIVVVIVAGLLVYFKKRKR